MSEDREISRREVLTGFAGTAGGYIVAQRLKREESTFVGPGGDSDNEGRIMPGEVKEQYYYPTIAQFEEEIGEPGLVPALVFTDEGVFAYDA